MKGIILIVVLITTIATAVDVIELFSGNVVPLGPYNTTVSFGKVTPKYDILTREDVIATGNAYLLFSLLQRMHKVGIFPLPPFDPYTKMTLAPLHFNDTNYLSGNVTFSALTVKGGKNYGLSSLELRMKTGRSDFVNYHRYLTVDTDFYADLLLSQLIPVKLHGHLSVLYEGVTLSGALQDEQTRLDGYGRKIVFQVSGAKLNFQAKNVSAQFTEMSLGNDLIQSLSSAQNNPSLGKWLSTFRSAIDEYILKLYIDEVNTILSSLTSEQVLSYLLPRLGNADNM